MRKQPVTLNVTNLEMKKLDELAEKHHITRSDVLRMGIWKVFDAELDAKETHVDSIHYTIGKMIREELKSEMAKYNLT